MLDTFNPCITTETAFQWRIVRDFVAGEARVKNCGTFYLPKKSGSSDSDYEAYKARGKVGDYTNQALETFHGQIMRKRPVVDIRGDENMKLIIDDFNKEGDSFYQFASDVVHDNLQTFFGGILVDMPVAGDNVRSEHDAREAGISPYARYYTAESIVDWDYKYVNGVQKLCMVELSETSRMRQLGTDSFMVENRHRILELDDKGYYKVRILVEAENDKKEKVFVPNGKDIYPKRDGKLLTFIPFFFTPYKLPEPSLLYGVAELHKHYYLQSCDYENGVHMTTIPTGYVTGHMQEKDEDGHPVPIYLGKDMFLVFPEPDSKVGVLQFSGDGIEHCEKAIEQTLEQIGILGTRALSPDKAMSETSDAAKIHRTGENCKLGSYSRSMSEVFTKVLKCMAWWNGSDTNVSVALNTDFDSIAFDPNALNAIANLAREGKYPLPLVFEALKKGEYLPSDMDFREFGMLVSLEVSGATVEEVIDAYQKMRSGEKVEPKKIVVEQLNKDRASNDKSPDQTKQISMENGK